MPCPWGKSNVLVNGRINGGAGIAARRPRVEPRRVRPQIAGITVQPPLSTYGNRGSLLRGLSC
jgi:hypothetical protein